MTKQLTDKKVVGTSLVVSISDVSLNLVVGLITGSQSVISQSLQGFSDLLTATMLYYGTKKSKKKADKQHPLGYGREIFFWTFLAAILMFIGTGTISLLIGYRQFTNPQVIENVWLAFAMLTFGLLTNFYSFTRSLQRLKRREGTDVWWRRFWRAGLIETKATLLIDFLGTSAAVFGLVSLTAYATTNNARFDGLGSILIGISMMTASILLINDIHSLIVGKTVPKIVSDKINKAALKVRGVDEVLDMRTIYVGSSNLLVLIELHISDGLKTNQIEALIDRVKKHIKEDVPEVYYTQVEVETPDEEIIIDNT